MQNPRVPQIGDIWRYTSGNDQHYMVLGIHAGTGDSYCYFSADVICLESGDRDEHYPWPRQNLYWKFVS